MEKYVFETFFLLHPEAVAFSNYLSFYKIRLYLIKMDYKNLRDKKTRAMACHVILSEKYCISVQGIRASLSKNFTPVF